MNTHNESPRLKFVLPLLVCAVAFLAVLYFFRPGRTATPVASDPPAAAPPIASPAAQARPAPESDPVQEKWGITIDGLHLAVGGNLLDLRYTVLDTEKAALLIKQKRETFLVDEATGEQLVLPKTAGLGSMRKTDQRLQPGYRYFLHFPNPGRRLQPGSKVTVAIGNFRAEHLTVQ